MHRVLTPASFALLALPLLTLPLAAQAHDGHGAPAASHWHATDTLGLLVTLGGIATMWWLGRRK
jgi:hypothetical protein